MAEIIVKKTFEISQKEKQELVELFNAIFNRNRSVIEFDNQFQQNALGYSYHVLLVDNDIIVGSISHIPSYYFINDQRCIFALGVDAMIKKKYRDFFYYYDMLTALNEFAHKDGSILLLTFPNEISNPILSKAKLSSNIGKLSTYVLPYRLGGIKKNTSFLNFLSITLSWTWVYTTYILSSRKVYTFPIKKDPETFNESRYNRSTRDYQIIQEDDFWFSYKIMEFKGIRTAFLIDVQHKSSYNFNKAIRFILKKHKNDFDILIYAGHLPFSNMGLIKIPEKFEPKQLNVSAFIFDESVIDTSLIFNLNNWDLCLSDTDLI